MLFGIWICNDQKKYIGEAKYTKQARLNWIAFLEWCKEYKSYSAKEIIILSRSFGVNFSKFFMICTFCRTFLWVIVKYDQIQKVLLSFHAQFATNRVKPFQTPFYNKLKQIEQQ